MQTRHFPPASAQITLSGAEACRADLVMPTPPSARTLATGTVAVVLAENAKSQRAGAVTNRASGGSIGRFVRGLPERQEGLAIRLYDRRPDGKPGKLQLTAGIVCFAVGLVPLALHGLHPGQCLELRLSFSLVGGQFSLRRFLTGSFRIDGHAR